jgi:DNA repair ATPase RecN
VVGLGAGVRLEDIVAELRALVRRKPLKGEDLERAKELMLRLREMGFTNREISELTDGGWSEPTIKSYTRGAAVRDPSPKENVLRILSQMVDKGLTLEDVELAISMMVRLTDKGVSFEDVVDFIEFVEKNRVDLGQLLQMFRELRSSGLSISQLTEVLSYRSRLEEVGVTIEGLKEIYAASEAYGGYEEVLRAIKAYGSLKAIEAEIEKMESKKMRLEKDLERLSREVEELRKEKAGIEDALKLYEELRNLGFDENVLEELRESSEKYGGVKGVLEAVNAYKSLVDLKSEINELEKRKSDLESDLKKVEAEHAHLMSVIEMCETLLYKFKFSVPAIADIYEMAKRYGEPLEVLKAVGRYGELRAIEESIEKLTARKNELEARVKALENQVQELRALIDEMRRQAEGLLKPFVKRISEAIDLLGQKFSQSLDVISSKYEEYAKRLGELKAELGKLEEELRLARVIQSLMKYPSECRELPLDYDILMLRAIMEHCKVKGVNPRVKAGDIIAKKYFISSHIEVELLDILEWAMRGLISSLAPSEKK